MIMSQKKVALVGFRLSGGGADRVMANLSNYFHEKGLNIHIIIFHNELGYDHSGTVFNLGNLKSKTNSIFNKIKRFYHFNKYIKQHQFDFIIDFRFRKKIIQELLISKFIYKTNIIYTVHSSKLNIYLPNFSTLTRLLYGKCYRIVSITSSMQRLIEKRHKLNNVDTIYNPINVAHIISEASKTSSLNFEYIIGIGEYDVNIKQFDKLIKVYSQSILPSKNIALVILGKGKLKDYLLGVAKENNVEQYVHLLGFKSNPYAFIKKAKFLVLSSQFEGLPMVIIESLVCSTPVVSFDCPTGPREVVVNKENGLLVEHNNIEKLKDAINLFVEDEILYAHCKKNTLSSIDKFTIDKVGKQWLELMNTN